MSGFGECVGLVSFDRERFRNVPAPVVDLLEALSTEVLRSLWMCC